MSELSPDLVVRDVRPWGGEPVDLVVDDGRIAEVRPAGAGADEDRDEEAEAVEVVEGQGWLCLPSFSDVHVHLDSTRLGLPFRPHTGAPGVWAMMLNDREHWRSAEAPVRERVQTTVDRMVASGVTTIRSHAQVDVDARLERFEAVLAAQEDNADRADIEVVAFPQAGLLRERGSAEVLEEAVRAGADLVGGLDPCELDRDPVEHLDIVFGLAERHGLPVDIHLHERGLLGAFTMELICERVRSLSMQGRVTISHAFALPTVDAPTRARLLEQLAELDIALTTVAPAGPQTLPLKEIRAAGVRIGLGQDGQRDYWSPYGNGDLLDRTWQLAFTNNVRADADIEACVEVATLGGRAVRGLDREASRSGGQGATRGLGVGDPADLVLLPGETVTSAVMDRPEQRRVLHRGQVVA